MIEIGGNIVQFIRNKEFKICIEHLKNNCDKNNMYSNIHIIKLIELYMHIDTYNQLLLELQNIVIERRKTVENNKLDDFAGILHKI